MPVYGLSSVYLTQTPFRQVFTAKDFRGFRVYLSNEKGVIEGLVVVEIHDYYTGELLYEYLVSANEIGYNGINSFYDSIAEKGTYDGTDTYYLDMYLLGIEDKKIKTYIGAISRDEFWPVIHEGDEKDYSNKMLYMDLIVKGIPYSFVAWLMITAFLIAALIFWFTWEMSEGNLVHERAGIPSSKYGKLIVIPIAIILLGVLGAFEPKERVVESDSAELKGGYDLPRHTSYVEKFTVKYDNLKSINVKLQAKMDNTALFVMAIQKGKEEVIATVQSDEIDDFADYRTEYIWDVSELSLNKGEEFDLFIYTGYINDNEEMPVLENISYTYGK